ncbi:MAG: hypothetical protein CTY31_04115 [Hyphomicrobium sp.]|nr:MAG: hypothetical protein CTY31_04115 [Hyphomicrobium sp.]
MTSDALRDIAYRLPWRSSSVRNGTHRSRMTGGGGVFKDLAPLINQPDPRRLALRASLADPFETLKVKRLEQSTAISVYVLVDVSASMAFRGETNKIEIAADLSEAISICASRAGDDFGLIAFDLTLRPETFLSRTRSRSAHRDAVAKLRSLNPTNAGVTGISEAAAMLVGPRKLVFLISDFLWSDDELKYSFADLAAHDVIPIEIDDSRQIDKLPDWGLLRLYDIETSTRRLVAMRPKLKEEWRRRRNARRASLHARCAEAGRDAFQIKDRIDWDRLSSYLMYGYAA